MLYSAAGNSADEQWYRKGIISYSFETGADRMITNPTTGAITQQITGFQPCYSGLGTGGGTGTCNSNMINEGRDQAMEFAGGNYGMVESAYDYATDTKAPSVSIEYSEARPTARRSTSSSTGTTKRRSSTTRRTAPRRPSRRRSTTTSALAPSARC